MSMEKKDEMGHQSQGASSHSGKALGNSYMATLFKVGMSLLFGICVFLFWRICKPFALAYQEQFQLFLFDRQYFLERIFVPGGFATYLSEFLVQFYNSVALGAVIVALVHVCLQVLVWQLVRRVAGRDAHGIDVWYPVSFVPSLMLWFLLGDESVLLAFPFSLLMVLLLMLFEPRGKHARLAFAIFGIPIAYWLAGPVVMLLSFYIAVNALRDIESKTKGCLVGLAVILYAAFCILASSLVVPYPVSRLACGIYYYRFVDMLPYLIVGIPVVILLIVFCAARLPRIRDKKKKQICIVSEIVVMLVVGGIIVPMGFNAKTYELIEYDYLVRYQRWEDVIAKAEKQQPDLPMSVCATNLALGMKGLLGDRMFDFYQNGTEGLLPDFERNFTSTMLTGEVYYRLGLVNTAQRFAFESMEAIPNYNKSGRMIKRLAETNIINGQYKVAEKYLRMLDKTIFYRRWAQDRMKLLGNDKLVDNHPIYGMMRKLRLDKDFLFSEIEHDKMVGQLFMHNTGNVLAMQYLLAEPLLNRDINTFMQYFGYVQSEVNYCPRSCQEAVAFAYAQKRMQPPAGMVSENVMRNLSAFARAYSSGGKGTSQFELFRNTCWYYLMK